MPPPPPPGSMPPPPPGVGGAEGKTDRDDAAASLADKLASRPTRAVLREAGIARTLSTNDMKVMELESENSALRAQLQHQSAEHAQDLQDMNDQHKKEVRESSSDTAVTSYKLHQMRDEHQRQLGTIEEDVRRRIGLEFRKKTGVMYAKLEEQVRAELSRESQRKFEKVEADARNREDKFTRDYQRVLEEAESKVQSRYQEISGEFQNTLFAQRDDWEQQRSKDLGSVTEEWVTKWERREMEYLEKDRERDAAHQEAVGRLQKEYEKLQKNSVEQAEVAAKRRNRADLDALEVKLTEMRSEKEATMRVQESYEKQVQEKYEVALRKEKELDQQVRDEADQLRRHEVEALEAAITEERKMYTTARTAMEESHLREVTGLKDLMEENRKLQSNGTKQFEQELEAKYALLAQGLADQAKEEQGHRLSRALNDLERRALLEQEKAKIRFEAERDAEAALADRFEAMSADLRTAWQKEETARANQAEKRLRAHFETVLAHSHEQLLMALKLNDEVDRRWMIDVGDRQESQLQLMKRFQEKCKRLYDDRLAEYVEQTDGQLREYEAQLLSAGAKSAQREADLRRRLRHTKVACQRWRMDYAAASEAKYTATATEMEERYQQQIKELYRVLAQRKEKEAIDALLVQHKAQEVSEFETQRLVDRERKREESAQKAATDAEGRSKLRMLQQSIAKLWKAMESTSDEKMDFFDALQVRIPGDMVDIVDMYEREAALLGAKLPLVQHVTRREFIKYRLKCIHRFAEDPSKRQEFTASAGAETRDLLLSELSILNERIRQGIEQFERKYDSPFLFRGLRYIDTMEHDDHRVRRRMGGVCVCFRVCPSLRCIL